MLPLASSTWGEEEIEAINEVVRSGRFTMGEKTKEYEQAFASYIGTKYAVACNSGSSANLLMVAAYTFRYGKGTVIVPAVAWATSYSPFQQYGWRLVFLDIDEHTLNFNPSDLWGVVEKYDDPLILAVNLLGNPNDFNAFPRKAHVLEDNCESLGAEYDGRKTGSFGRMASHSTFFSHHICTMEGGVVTTNDEYLYQMPLCLRAHGWTRNLPENNVFGVKPGKFDFILPGYNLRPTEMQCAIGLRQLEKLDGFIEARRENASRFPLPTQKEIGKSSWFGFAVFGDENVERVSKVCESRPIVTGNFLRSPSIKYYDYEVFGETTGADYVHDHACFIGNHHYRVDWTL
ncbi:MAG TPA: DegT/DnrJ/EryC1/StrS family aminotransferase [Nitrososphaera sp.]|nr:DegT/DnrJ/EryC1/StrS family aminotransferase [Nitrososphaera sp.]